LRTVVSTDIEEVARMQEFEKGAISLEEARKANEYKQSTTLLNVSRTRNTNAERLGEICAPVVHGERNGANFHFVKPPGVKRHLP